MDDEDGGDAKGKLAVLGFVAEDVHAQEGADAAAGDGQPDEGVLRDAPLPSDGLPFVDALNLKGQDVDADEVDDEVAHGGTCADKLEFKRLFSRESVRLISIYRTQVTHFL